MGKVLSEDEKNKKSWDSNAITPGTPFMTLLASSLKYWVVEKMNTDPGWKQVCIALFRLDCSIYRSSSWRLFYRMLVSLEKENTKSWTLSVGNVRTRVMILIHAMLFMVW